MGDSEISHLKAVLKNSEMCHLKVVISILKAVISTLKAVISILKAVISIFKTPLLGLLSEPKTETKGSRRSEALDFGRDSAQKF